MNRPNLLGGPGGKGVASGVGVGGSGVGVAVLAGVGVSVGSVVGVGVAARPASLATSGRYCLPGRLSGDTGAGVLSGDGVAESPHAATAAAARPVSALPKKARRLSWCGGGDVRFSVCACSVCGAAVAEVGSDWFMFVNRSPRKLSLIVPSTRIERV